MSALVHTLKNRAQVKAAVHRVLIDWQRKTIVGEERRLGPSLQEPQHAEHIFAETQHGYVFGTRVPYSRAHAKHRRERGMGDHLELPQEVLDELGAIIGQQVAQSIFGG
jgi:hypothetical protein